ncbi:formimidoylglutamase [Tsukamurella spumae]|uniref:Formimidoylglutamase n=1 Tax=Tsukamurella spumae TaxID=44753 RepID=A0A846X0E8_9ACTN|nr:formimidoylglutamase [Tsukamurella spumae]NKY18581.1 formimidoylglutamase [Tsukamurella spumae]
MSLRPAPEWTGRIDGAGDEHLRWHSAVRPFTDAPGPGAVVVGFASDAGVRRNHGRPGAADGPDALRAALGPLALQQPLSIEDAGTVVVGGDALEAGQALLATTVTTALDAGRLPVVLGGGHEVAYGTYCGLAASRIRSGRKVAIVNLDAHFDLREADRATSGTPFRQILLEERARGAEVRYAVAGIARTGNTRALFDTATRLGVTHLLDEDCTHERTIDFVDEVLDWADLVYLTIDLDVLPAATAPGVSAPAGLGVPLTVVHAAVRRVAESGKLAVADVAELNPAYDIDARTARTAARLIDTIVTTSSRTNRRHRSGCPCRR